MPVPDIADRRHRSAGYQAADAGVVPRHASAWPRQVGNIQHRVGPAAWDLDQRCLAASAQADASPPRPATCSRAKLVSSLNSVWVPWAYPADGWLHNNWTDERSVSPD